MKNEACAGFQKDINSYIWYHLIDRFMIFVTQLIYVKAGQEDTFHKFEDVAIPLISKYNGTLMLRIRPTESVVIENNIDTPYEVHLVSFNSEKDLENFMQADERKEFLHLKQESVQSAVLIKGNRI
jgi:hypothetical protein